MYVRYRSPIPNSRGARVGIFALANGLAASGQLTDEEAQWLRSSNDWYNSTYDQPAETFFDRRENPVTECWFKVPAAPLIARVEGYLRLLDRHGVSWERVESEEPGLVLYEDDVQVVVAVAPAR